MKPVVVLSSQDPEFCFLLQYILEAEGYAVCLATKPDQVIRLADHPSTHAILLDCLADNLDAICKGLKRGALTGRIPIAALVGANSDRHIDLIEAGIDESLVRPLAPARLLQFLKTGVTSGQQGEDLGRFGSGRTLRQLEIEINLASQSVRCNGQPLDLAPIGFRLLQYFLQFPNVVHSRQSLIAAAWRGTRRVDPRTVDVHIGRLRQALRSLSGYDAIRTVRTAGYMLETRARHSV
ncbi:response regulator transcription factor [Mesorhizobium qingshengii]|uniref:Two-component system, OmpR family, phosphate regulon response regulator PhoB n=1 Tax=Mesorhizobium qingshengii TaxID=1165689 RepID=A0A1G5WK02_9HYPH|nr:response regulator transcription factor [Mesorhizobium qingshengii]SDA58234.1 two-component system, OmpR family, phosphate regulon response regulator PhoB [Mesorhizobium qingshengii]